MNSSQRCKIKKKDKAQISKIYQRLLDNCKRLIFFLLYTFSHLAVIRPPMSSHKATHNPPPITHHPSPIPDETASRTYIYSRNYESPTGLLSLQA